MLTLLIGFVGMVLLPALILSLVLNRLNKIPAEFPLRDESRRFTISPDVKP